MATIHPPGNEPGSEARPTAKIYQFPARPRARLVAMAGPGEISQPAVPVLNASGWYHQVAMAESDGARGR